MAATRLIALHLNKGRTVAQCLEARTDYAKNPEKTEKGELVTAYLCDPYTVDEEFMLAKRKYFQTTGKTQKNDVIAYQIRQSFKPGEITPEEANRLGHELAIRFTKGKFAVIVATHTDRNHIHNHIVFNSTSVEGDRKFRNFWFSGLALQKVSDLVCLENGYSIIETKSGAKRQRGADFPRKEKVRDIICGDIDKIIQNRPNNFEDFLFQLQKQGYEIKRGKHLALKSRAQERYVRFSSLPDGYKENDLREFFMGEREHEVQKQNRSLNLIVDIQNKMQSKGIGYQRWATVYNLKQMSKTLLFLRDHDIESIEQLNEQISKNIEKREHLLASMKTKEERLTQIASLKMHIINYSKTRGIYEQYQKTGYSKRFWEEHREEITLHKAAKAAFEELDVKKIPKVRELSAEYENILGEKKKEYAEYRQTKERLREYLIAQKNVASLYDVEQQERMPVNNQGLQKE